MIEPWALFYQKQQNVMIKRPTTCNNMYTNGLAMEFFQSFFQLAILGRLVRQERGKHKALLQITVGHVQPKISPTFSKFILYFSDGNRKNLMNFWLVF